jgi:ectoine hydroxylase
MPRRRLRHRPCHVRRGRDRTAANGDGTDPEVADHLLDRLDAEGAATRIALWNRAGDSVYGMAARCARMVDTMEALLGGPVYHFQSKLTAKQPFVGGAWEWHQDYGYWYHNGCIFPHLASCQVALDRSTSANGCLQMVQGSHLLGRIDHVPVPGEARTSPIPRACVPSSNGWP